MYVFILFYGHVQVPVLMSVYHIQTCLCPWWLEDGTGDPKSGVIGI